MINASRGITNDKERNAKVQDIQKYIIQNVSKPDTVVYLRSAGLVCIKGEESLGASGIQPTVLGKHVAGQVAALAVKQ